MERKRRLPRLNPGAYQDRAFVHWIVGFEHRSVGWLDHPLHWRLRELFVHVCVRYRLILPCYVLMPDHAHLLFVGMAPTSDQRPAMRLLRKHWAAMLPVGHSLQRQAYDRVLRDTDRQRDPLQHAADYIFENPQRAGLVDDWRAWEFCGAIVPGFPSLDPRKENFWTSLWFAHDASVAEF